MAKHTNKRTKPDKPYADFPLFPHATGRWAKKVKGRMRYFGPWVNPDRAVALWKAQRDDLLAGREPSVTDVTDDGEPVVAGATVKLVCDEFLTAKETKRDAGELKAASFDLYLRTCKTIADVFGRNRAAEDLTPADFNRLKAAFAKGRGKKTPGIASVSNEVRRTRTVFKRAYDMRLVNRPANFGPDFRQASAGELRRVRQRNRAEHGKLLFTPAEINGMLAKASVPMRAMLLLGINCGLGQEDCANLRLNHLDLAAGTLDYPRPKTGVERRAVLWPVTVKAIRAAIKARPEPVGDTPANLVFVTRHGARWVRFNPGTGSSVDSISQETDKLLRSIDAKRKGLNFYSLRRTFQTIAAEAGDIPAIRLVMGHHDEGDMTARYTQHIGDDRLRAACWRVREWLGTMNGDSTPRP